MNIPKSGVIETPVLVVGGGPVGLALALDLGRRGVECVVVEQNAGQTDHPKASAINARSMEFFRRWGVSEQVKTAAAPDGFPHTAFYCTSLAGFEIARIERPNHGGRAPTKESPERPQRCNQIWLDPILRDAATDHECVTLWRQCRFERLAEKTGHVESVVADLATGEERLIVSRYVVDCSGGRSPIRAAFGVDMKGSDYLGYFISVFVRIPNLWDYHDKGRAALIDFVDEKGAWRNFVLLDGRELYRMAARSKEFYDAPDKVDIESLFRKACGRDDVPHEFISTRRWSARNVVADAYKIGRVMLAGDAAHINHPASGIGLNTGLGDIWDLGWKLEAVLKGWGGTGLLDAYEAERRPVGQGNIDHANTSHAADRALPPDPAIAEDSPAGAAARKRLGDDIMAKAPKKFITDGIALGYRYAHSPLIAGDGSPEPPRTISTYEATTWPGSRAPHAFLPDGRSTIDLYGEGFHLLRLGEGAPSPEPLVRAFAARGAPLAVTTVASPEIAALHERSLVLVRPDGHVAWRGDAAPADPAALADKVRGA